MAGREQINSMKGAQINGTNLQARRPSGSMTDDLEDKQDEGIEGWYCSVCISNPFYVPKGNDVQLQTASNDTLKYKTINQV